MSKAWDGAMLMYKEEGRKDGIIKGIELANRQTTLSMYRRNYSAEDAAALVQESVETVKRWYSEFANE